MIFPLKDVEIKFVQEVPFLAAPLYSCDSMQVSPDQCRMEIPGIGVFYIVDGREIWCASEAGVDHRHLEAHMGGFPVAAVLHQRGMLHFHASSFVWRDKGILLFGQSGAGKSSLAAAFHMAGAIILSDDLSPIEFSDGAPYIIPIGYPVRLRPEILCQFNLKENQLKVANAFTGKVILNTGNIPEQNHRLDIMVYLEKHNGSEFQIETPPPDEQFALLRSEICHWEILKGMPDTERKYLAQILEMLKAIPVLRIRRPENCPVAKLHRIMDEHLR
ncbi:MAG TPA: hypothetical protein VLH61_09385 [Bacteroidales bacterium]|nr:hypothetical protein [Bacteroidales bacterium]